MNEAEKREGITTDDLIACGRNCNVGTVPKLKSILNQVSEAITQWPGHAEAAGLPPSESTPFKPS